MHEPCVPVVSAMLQDRPIAVSACAAACTPSDS